MENNASAAQEPRTEAQARYNLRPNRRTRNCSNRLFHAMDSPANTQSYETQFLQHGEDDAPTLQEAVQEMHRTGSDADVLKYITGIVTM
jgi:hypothetical protein